MSTNNNNFNIIGLDFDEAKASLKAFLQSQDTLKDYNFDGSVLSTILDVLAYNTHYQAFYANMVANEMFLDSAVLRPSVVSHAKTLGYVPSSRRASKAVLTVNAAGATDSTYLARGSEFVGTNAAGTQYRFVLLDTVYANGATDKFENIEIYEGTLRRMSYVYDPTKKSGSVLLIPNNKIDTTTIRVRVKSSATDNSGIGDSWTHADSYIDLTPTSKVYFLQEKETGMYELYFGDNFLGMQPQSGSIVIVEYLETNADEANSINRFTSAVSGLGTITVVSASSGGVAEESVSRIKFLAPKYYTAQSRAVTENDYKTMVMREYPSASSVYVYGGEDVDPPQYGKVFIALKPNTGSALTAQEKTSLIKRLRDNRSVVTVTPEIVDPDYIDLVIDSIITFDPSLTSIGAGTLKSIIVAYLYTYSTSTLESFGSNFYLSKIIQAINGLNAGVVSNQTSVKMRKTINLSRLLVTKGFSIDFKNPINRVSHMESDMPTLASSIFSHRDLFGVLYNNVSAVDNSDGRIDLVRIDEEGMSKLVYQNIGSVDYDKGIVRFNTNFSPTGSEIFLTITVEPQNDDLFVFENKMFRISRAYSDSIAVNLITQSNRKKAL
jgi:hypothetical protein